MRLAERSQEPGKCDGGMIESRTEVPSLVDGKPVVAPLPEPLAEAVQGSIAFTQSPRMADLGQQGLAIAQAAKEAFVDGVTVSITVGAGVLLLAAVLVLWRGPSKSQMHEGLGKRSV